MPPKNVVYKSASARNTVPLLTMAAEVAIAVFKENRKPYLEYKKNLGQFFDFFLLFIFRVTFFQILVFL